RVPKEYAALLIRLLQTRKEWHFNLCDTFCRIQNCVNCAPAIHRPEAVRLNFSWDSAKCFGSTRCLKAKIERLHLGKPACVFVRDELQIPVYRVHPPSAGKHQYKRPSPRVGFSVVDSSGVPDHEAGRFDIAAETIKGYEHHIRIFSPETFERGTEGVDVPGINVFPRLCLFRFGSCSREIYKIKLEHPNSALVPILQDIYKTGQKSAFI